MRIETPRLIITKFDLSMAHSVHVQSLDEDNRRFLPDEVFETEEEARSTLAYLIRCYSTQDGPFVFPVLLKDGRHIGHVQLIPCKTGWEAGYHIGRDFCQKGYATEALSAFLEAVHLSKPVWGICAAENIASRRVLEKCGFQLIHEGPGVYQGKERLIAEYCNNPT